MTLIVVKPPCIDAFPMFSYIPAGKIRRYDVIGRHIPSLQHLNDVICRRLGSVYGSIYFSKQKHPHPRIPED